MATSTPPYEAVVVAATAVVVAVNLHPNSQSHAAIQHQSSPDPVALSGANFEPTMKFYFLQ